MSVRRCGLLVLCVCVAAICPVRGQSEGRPLAARGVRTIVYHARDLIALRAKLHYTTLIVLPEGDEVVEATCGDKELWILNARGPLVSVKPARAGGETNLNLVTTSGQVYAFVLTEISNRKGEDADLTVYVEPDDPAAATAARDHPKYVPAQQVDEVRAQLELARTEAHRAAETARSALEERLTAFRTAYPLSLAFPYRFKPDAPPFFVHAMFHDDHRTFIQAHPPELPALYELTDGAPILVNFDVHDGTYVVPKILDRGYLMLGGQRIAFARAAPR
jgi:conjugative transfer protein CagX